KRLHGLGGGRSGCCRQDAAVLLDAFDLGFIAAIATSSAAIAAAAAGIAVFTGLGALRRAIGGHRGGRARLARLGAVLGRRLAARLGRCRGLRFVGTAFGGVVAAVAPAMAVAVAVAAFAALVVASAALAVALGGLACGFSGGLGGFGRRTGARQPVDELPEQAGAFRGGTSGGRGRRRGDRSRLRGRDALDQRFRTRFGFLSLVGRPGHRGLGL